MKLWPYEVMARVPFAEDAAEDVVGEPETAAGS